MGPKEGFEVSCTVLSGRQRETHHGSLSIDRRGGAGGIAGKRRQFLHCAIRFPDDRSELQGLESGVARRVYDAVLRPTNDLATVVQRRGIAVEPARKRRKRGHSAVGPSKAITYFSGGAA